MLGVQGKVTGFDALLEEHNMSQIQIISQEKEIGILHQGQVGREVEWERSVRRGIHCSLHSVILSNNRILYE